LRECSMLLEMTTYATWGRCYPGEEDAAEKARM